jgi:hypothetical protein
MSTTTMMGTLMTNVTGAYIVLEKSASSETIAGALGDNNTAIAWDSSIHKGSGFTHDVVTNNSRITVGATGRYQIICGVAADNTHTDRLYFNLVPKVDGTTTYTQNAGADVYNRGSGYNGGEFRATVVTELEITAASYVEIIAHVWAQSASMTVNTIDGECQLIIRRIG